MTEPNVCTAFYKMKINDVERPERNHPLHDSAVAFDYLKKRYTVVVVFDGVSESKEATRNMVSISRELEWDLEQYCRAENPHDINDIARWFIHCVSEEKYRGMGATTISLLRFDREQNAVDGFTVGDSPALLARRVVEHGESVFEAQVLAELDCVVNYPGVITEQWRYDTPVKIAPFTVQIPERFDELFLVCMTDGFGKLSDADTLKYIDDDLQDRMVALAYPHFARVYPPEELLRNFPLVPIASDGSVAYLNVVQNEALGCCIAEAYPTMNEKVRRQTAMVDLDTMALYEFYTSPEAYAASVGQTVERILADSHPALSYMLKGIYNGSRDESGLDEYLREYVRAELFTASMLEEMLSEEDAGRSLQQRLKTFFGGLDPIGDDFSVSLMSLRP